MKSDTYADGSPKHNDPVSKPETSAETQHEYAGRFGRNDVPCSFPLAWTQCGQPKDSPIHRQPAATQPEPDEHLYPHEYCSKCGAVFETVNQKTNHRCSVSTEAIKEPMTSQGPNRGVADKFVDSTSTAAPELKPCPFCGKQPDCIPVEDTDDPFRARCGTLGCPVDIRMIRPQVWNTRADAAPRLTPEQARERARGIAVEVFGTEPKWTGLDTLIVRLIDRIATELLSGGKESENG